MVTVRDHLFLQKTARNISNSSKAAMTTSNLNFGGESSQCFADTSRSAFNPNTFMHFNTNPNRFGASVMTNEEESDIRLSDYIIEDIPLLVSDNEEASDDEEAKPVRAVQLKSEKPSDTAEEVKRSMKVEADLVPTELKLTPADETKSSVITTQCEDKPTSSPISSVSTAATTPLNKEEVTKKIEKLTAAQFQFERKQLMTIVVKYISTKIINSFPPESPHTIKPNELPLDKFLLILVSRLQLSMNTFMKGVIYLFRYMDIIYLLRYLNQSNNFANYNEMDFGLKKLIVGCFKLTLIRERVNKDWHAVTGLPNNEINRVAKTIVNRLNGKIMIKDVELVKLKLEIFRFVKMVTHRI